MRVTHKNNNRDSVQEIGSLSNLGTSNSIRREDSKEEVVSPGPVNVERTCAPQAWDPAGAAAGSSADKVEKEPQSQNG